MCECQNISFNKNALVLFSSNYINWILIATFAQHICENCISTFFYNNRLCLLLCILTSSIRNFRANFFNDVIFSTMRVLKSSCKFSQRCDFLSDTLFEIFEQTFSTRWILESNRASMRKLQKRTNRNSIIYWFQIWRKVEL